MTDLLLRFVLYGCFGWCVEIVFTAATESYESGDWRLTGRTYLWMFPIYGSVVLLFEPAHDLIRDYPWYARAAIWSLGITGVEWIAGWVLAKTTGSCPWDYSYSKFAINPYIRADYFPVWAVFGLILEVVHDFFVALTPAIRAAL